MDPIDLEIQKRLDKLKEPLQNLPSEDELKKRLNDLKETPIITDINNKYVLLSKPQSDTQQINDLIKQFSDEIALPASSSCSVSISELEHRLRNLKSQNDNTKQLKKQPSQSDTKILLKKILAESELEKRTQKKFTKSFIKSNDEIRVDDEISSSDSDSMDEFCYICDKSPKWICLNCDKELFCSKCFIEYHNEIEECHQRKPYK